MCDPKNHANKTCEHWESKIPNYHGHCSHASCPNYMNACPIHCEG